MTMEIKIDDTFEYEGKMLKVVEAERNTCFGCYFSDGACCNNTELGHCGGENTDYKPVIFVEVQEPKKERFDPKTLKPFDRVLAASMADGRWVCDFFSHIGESIRDSGRLYVGTGFGAYDRMIPYNDETKHLVGTREEAPEFYRYWED